MSSKKTTCRQAHEVVSAIMKKGYTLQELAAKLEMSELTLKRFCEGGTYGTMTSYPTLKEKIERAFVTVPSLFEPGGIIPENIPLKGQAGTMPTMTAVTPSIPEKPKPAQPKPEPIKTAAPKQDPIHTQEPEFPMEKPVVTDTPPVRPIQKPIQIPETQSQPKAESNAAPIKQAETAAQKPMSYEQLSAKLTSEICASVKTAFATLKESHKDAIPKKPVFAGKEASELVDIIGKLSQEDLKFLLSMARRML